MNHTATTMCRNTLSKSCLRVAKETSSGNPMSSLSASVLVQQSLVESVVESGSSCTTGLCQKCNNVDTRTIDSQLTAGLFPVPFQSLSRHRHRPKRRKTPRKMTTHGKRVDALNSFSETQMKSPRRGCFSCQIFSEVHIQNSSLIPNTQNLEST